MIQIKRYALGYRKRERYIGRYKEREREKRERKSGK